MSEPIIELHELTKKYGKFTAVDHINLSVQKGEIFGILGPNGAGKSTTILMMLGLTDPTSGTVQVCGINSTRNPIQVREKVGYLPEDVGFYDDMTGIENLLYTARLNRIPEANARTKAEELLERVGLPVDTQKKAGKYSRGMRQRLGLADVLSRIYELVMGVESDGYTAIEISYSIGLALGIIVFYNHVGGRRLTSDPTPLEVEMRNYERDVNQAIVEMADRQKLEEDVE